MKRDWDVIREVLEEIEAKTPEQREGLIYVVDDAQPVEDQIKAEHVMLLGHAGFLKSIWSEDISGTMCVSPELTWTGHDLLDTIRSKSIWNKIKTTAKTKGIELTFDAVKALSKYALEEAMKG